MSFARRIRRNESRELLTRIRERPGPTRRAPGIVVPRTLRGREAIGGGLDADLDAVELQQHPRFHRQRGVTEV